MKKRSKLTSFFYTSPLTMAFGVLVALSFLVNLGLLLFVVLLSHTALFDVDLSRYDIQKVCGRDYVEVLRGLDSDTQRQQFAATRCFTDYSTGKPLDLDSVKPLK